MAGGAGAKDNSIKEGLGGVEGSGEVFPPTSTGGFKTSSFSRLQPGSSIIRLKESPRANVPSERVTPFTPVKRFPALDNKCKKYYPLHLGAVHPSSVIQHWGSGSHQGGVSSQISLPGSQKHTPPNGSLSCSSTSCSSLAESAGPPVATEDISLS